MGFPTRGIKLLNNRSVRRRPTRSTGSQPVPRLSLLTNHSIKSCLGLALMWALLASPAVAQQYVSKQVDEAARNVRYRAQQYAKSGSGGDEEYKRYIDNYAIPKLTDARPQGLAELGKLRYELFRDFIVGAAPSVQQDLTRKLMSEMQKVVLNNGGPFHPSVRYNAILIIGMLDTTYPDGRERTSVVLPAANEFLTNVVKEGLAGGKAPAPLVVGALVGLERHASVLGSLTAANQKATIDALVSIIETEDLPLEVSSSVEQWIRLMAARGLAATKSLGEGNRHHQALLKVINNDQLKLNIRCQAAEMLTELAPAYQNANGIDEKQLTQAMLQLASDVAADERQKAIDYRRKVVRGGVGSSYDTGEVQLPDPYQIRRTVLRLRGVLGAMRSARPAVKDEAMQQVLTDIERHLATTLQVAENKEVIALNLADEVMKMSSQVETIAARVGVEAAEPLPEDDEEEEEEVVGGVPVLGAEGQ